MARHLHPTRRGVFAVLTISAGLYLAGRLATAQQDRSESPADPVAGPRSADIDRYVLLQMDRNEIPALALAVIEDGEVVHKKAYGLANIELDVPARSSNLFQLSSTTKLFAAVAVLRLVEQGRLGLDEPIADFLPDLPQDWRRVTVRQLLGHLSGLPGLTESVAAHARTEVLDSMKSLPMLNAPGERFRYNQTNYFLLAIIAERVSGLGFEELMKLELFEPAGMTATVFAGGHRDIVTGRATTYVPDADGVLRVRAQDFPPHAYAGAGLNSNLDDLVRFDRALDSGALLDDAMRTVMWDQTATDDGQPTGYGLGWGVRVDSVGPVLTALSHQGGFMTTFRKYPEVGLTVIVLTNGYRAAIDPDAIADGVAAIFEPRAQEPAHRLTDEMWALISAGDSAAAVQLYRAFVRDSAATAFETGRAILSLGNALFATDRFDDAVLVLRLNVEAFPRGSSVRQSLGEALLAAGDTAEAIETLEEALVYDSGNAEVKRVLETLGAP